MHRAMEEDSLVIRHDDECDKHSSYLVQIFSAHGGEVMFFWSVCFRGGLGFLNYDDICMYVANKQFQLLEFVLIPFMLACCMMRFPSFLLLGMRDCVVSVGVWFSLVCL